MNNVGKLDKPRVVLGATGSNSGKTTISCAILRAIKNRGVKLQAFKCGPDYIDPMFHSRVVGVPSRNIDLFFTDRDTALYLVDKNAKEADMVLIEGVMGFYDGLGGRDTLASTYDVANKVGAPSILVVNFKGKALSVVAEIKGFLEYRQDNNIKGVILNRISPMYYNMMKPIIEEELGIQVYGFMPVLEGITLESRHLGLITADEVGNLEEIIEKLGEAAEKYIDIDGILELSEEASTEIYDFDFDNVEAMKEEIRNLNISHRELKVAVAKDNAFSFYYEDNLNFLEELGFKIEYFSPIKGEALPAEVSGLILGGGYPELYLEKISNNTTVLSILNALNQGLPCHAECGGFMYMQGSIEDKEGNLYRTLDYYKNDKSFYTGKLGRFGYVELEFQEDTILGPKGTVTRAHEFHYFDATNTGELCQARKLKGSRSWSCVRGGTKENHRVFAGFPHLYYYSNLDVPFNFAKQMVKFLNERN